VHNLFQKQLSTDRYLLRPVESRRSGAERSIRRRIVFQ